MFFSQVQLNVIKRLGIIVKFTCRNKLKLTQMTEKKMQLKCNDFIICVKFKFDDKQFSPRLIDQLIETRLNSFSHSEAETGIGVIH